jgi:phosphoglycerate dehydrogenase-like enzyme
MPRHGSHRSSSVCVSAVSVRVVVAPPTQRAYLRDAVVAGRGTLVDDARDADAVVWTSPHAPQELRALLDAHPHIRFVQLPWAGIEPYVSVLDRDRVWCGGQGVYSDDVAEHALALTLALLRRLPTRARSTSWGAPAGASLRNANVCILGGGGIALSLLSLLSPFSCRTLVVRKRLKPCGNSVIVLFENREHAIAEADVVIVALALTAETRHVIDAATLASMKRSAVIVNVARGGHIDTAALVDALQRGAIAGAALDVTDPEPLPPGHPLWSAPNILITPHTANTPEMAVPVLSARITHNIRALVDDDSDSFHGLIDVDVGY